MKTIKINYQCANCDHDFEVSVSPIIPAKISGPPENCYPAEGGEIDPCECPKCTVGVDEETIYDATEDARNDEWDAAAESRRDE